MVVETCVHILLKRPPGPNLLLISDDAAKRTPKKRFLSKITGYWRGGGGPIAASHAESPSLGKIGFRLIAMPLFLIS